MDLKPGMTWKDVTPQQAAELTPEQIRLLFPPLGEDGKPCPWPWDPQQLKGAPLGQYHCPYCGSMVMAGQEHLDYRLQSVAEAIQAHFARVVQPADGDPRFAAWCHCKAELGRHPTPEEAQMAWAMHVAGFLGEKGLA